MTSKKQIADIENTIMLLEEKIERLEEEHITMKQMISMQNALIDNLQMMVKMLSLQTPSVPQKQQVIHIGGDGDASYHIVDDEQKDTVMISATDKNNNKSYYKQRMSRVA
jgi:hypothetical protein